MLLQLLVVEIGVEGRRVVVDVTVVLVVVVVVDVVLVVVVAVMGQIDTLQSPF